MDRNHLLGTLRERILAFPASRGSRAHAEDQTQEVLVVLHETKAQEQAVYVMRQDRSATTQLVSTILLGR